ncbi:MAG: hypothetical protein MUP90_18320 [Gammaproteobacteria bacterium]|nr:hypothetical protein [Gammaproteobacteria bacterium]
MFSPAVLCDLVDGGGPALDLLRRRSPRPPAAANLCSSLVGEQGLSEAILEQAVQHLLQQLALGT